MLNIFLGNACNFNCGYCLQSKESPARLKLPDYDKFVDTFADKVADGVAYWGGEPLLYWKDIKEIHNRFVAKGLKIPFIKILTNGSLITDECVEDANSWGASIRLSYHGDHSKIRYDKLKNIDNFGITYVLHGQQYNIYDCFRHTNAAEQLMNRPVHTYAHWVRATPATPKEYWFKDEQLVSLHINLLNVAKDALNGDRRSCEFFFPHFTIWQEAMKGGVAKIEHGLCSSPSITNVTVNGDYFNCHHSSDTTHKIGNVYDIIPIRSINAELAAKRFISSDTCQACPLKSWCKGNCHVSQTHSIDCKLSKIKANVFEFLELNHFTNVINNMGIKWHNS